MIEALREELAASEAVCFVAESSAGEQHAISIELLSVSRASSREKSCRLRDCSNQHAELRQPSVSHAPAGSSTFSLTASNAVPQVLEIAYLHPDLCQKVARAAARHTIPDLKMTITYLETRVLDLSLQVESAARALSAEKVALTVLEADKSRFQ